MNKIVCSVEPGMHNHESGSIYLSISYGDTAKDYYILSNHAGNWQAINLTTGNVWTEPSKSVTVAVDGLTFVKRGAKITIE